MAESCSNGEWKRAAHLEVVNHEFMSALDDPWLDVLIITCPPRHGKSEYFAHWAPTWYKLTYPSKRLMICTNTAKLARSHSRWIRDKCHEYAKTYGLKGVDPNNASASEWNLDGPGMGGCVSAGVGGSIVGYGCDLLIIDDYLKNAKDAYSETVRDSQWEWFLSTSSTRLEPGGKIVLFCTPWHEDDLIGRIKKNREELGLNVRCITLQALREDNGTKDPLRRQEGESLWPERWPSDVMERRKRRSRKWWNAIYQGRPGLDGDELWPPHYFANIYIGDDNDWPESRAPLSAFYIDPARGKGKKPGDWYSGVYICYHNGKLYVDSLMDRRPVEVMVRQSAAFAKNYQPRFVGVEGNAFQELIGPLFESACEAIGYNCDPPDLSVNTVPKHLRIERLGPLLESGQLVFRRTASNAILISQLREFPHGKHDDGPDALENAIRLLDRSVSGNDKANVDETDPYRILV